MTTFLDVETADFLDASRSMTGGVGDPVAHAVVSLQVRLGDCAAMAGADPGGTAWAASYDDAAVAGLSAAEEVVNAAYRVGAMFAQSARNYAAADAASAGHPVDVPVAGMFAQTSIGVGAPPPSAHGGSGSTPHGWTLIEGLVGRVWPDGHQGRLLAAASAWDAAANALDDGADATMLAGIPFGRDRLPEADDMGTVCESIGAHLRAVGSVFGQLASSCRDLAHHLDVVHSQVEHELISLLAQSAAIEAAGQAASVLTLGAAEAPTQALEGSRILAAAAKVRELIEAFTVLARAVAARIAAALERATQVAARARVLAGARLSAAEVELAARYPRVAQGLRDRLAIYRLDGDAGHVILRKFTVDLPQLERKFDRHASDFGVTSSKGRRGYTDFEMAMRKFMNSPDTRHVRGFNRGEPAILNYDPATRQLVIQHSDGAFWTCFTMKGTQLDGVINAGRIGLE